MTVPTNMKSPAERQLDRGRSGNYLAAAAARQPIRAAEALLWDLAQFVGIFTVWQDAYRAGLADGRAQVEDEIATLQRVAVEHARRNAHLPERFRLVRVEPERGRRWAA